MQYLTLKGIKGLCWRARLDYKVKIQFLSKSPKNMRKNSNIFILLMLVMIKISLFSLFNEGNLFRSHRFKGSNAHENKMPAIKEVPYDQC